MYIYVLQGVLLECMLSHYCKIFMNAGIYAFIIAPLIALLFLIVCYYLTVLIKKIKILDIVLFGAFKQK